MVLLKSNNQEIAFFTIFIWICSLLLILYCSEIQWLGEALRILPSTPVPGEDVGENSTGHTLILEFLTNGHK